MRGQGTTLGALPRPLARLVSGVMVAALGVVGVELSRYAGTVVPHDATFAVLAACGAASELVPILLPLVFPRASSAPNETVSTTFILATLILFGAVPTLLVFSLTLLAAEVLQRKPLWKMGFNVGQYAVAISAGGAVLDALRAGSRFSPASLVAMLAAGLTFSVINTVSVDIALAFNEQTRVLPFLRRVLPQQLATDAVLVAQGPVLVACAASSLWIVPLLGLPAAVVFLAAIQSFDLKVQSRRTVETLAAAVDRRDPYTYDHSARVGWYAAHLARAVRLPDHRVREIESAGLVHDLGKIGVPDAVLLKPGPLDGADWALMHEHPVIGEELLSHLDLYAGVRTMVRHHHERWDGTGYPDGLLGDGIPVGSRVVAIADTFDAMTTDRPYRPGLSLREALTEIRACAGRQFDPALAEAFCALLETQPSLVRSHARASRLIGDHPAVDSELVPGIALDASQRG